MALSPQVQVNYVPDFLQGIPGQLADINRFDSVSGNLEGATNIPFGVGLKKGVSQDGYILPAASGDLIEGIAIHSHAINNIGFGSLTPFNIGVFPGQMFSILRQGYVYLLVEEAVVAHDPVFCRFQPSTNAVDSAGPWAPNFTYIVNQQVTNYGNLYKCTTAGTSGAPGGPPSGGPSSGSGIGGSTVGGPFGTATVIADNSVIWTYVSPALKQIGGFRKSNDTSTAVAWVASTVYALNALVTNGGNVYGATVAGTAAGSGGPSGTGAAIVDGTVTWKFLGPTGVCASLIKGAKYLSNAAAGTVARAYYDAGVAAN